jgi:ankyrin repeat protein
VHLLLASGAEVNAEAGYYSYALHAATYEGHERVVRLLLEHGADLHVETCKTVQHFSGQLLVVMIL